MKLKTIFVSNPVRVFRWSLKQYQFKFVPLNDAREDLPDTWSQTRNSRRRRVYTSIPAAGVVVNEGEKEWRCQKSNVISSSSSYHRTLRSSLLTSATSMKC